LLIPLWILALVNIFYGIDAGFPAGLAADGAAVALGLGAAQ
jgi:multicomponent Na+:H+ antiporter subunit D